jgi:hypothetical protein
MKNSSMIGDIKVTDLDGWCITYYREKLFT